MTDSLEGYDTWKTAEPPELELFCPQCGMPYEDMEELDVDGLGFIGLLKYPLYVPDENSPTHRRRLHDLDEMRAHATPVNIYKCECGWIGTDDALVT